jgi:hypothetical protein
VDLQVETNVLEDHTASIFIPEVATSLVLKMVEAVCSPETLVTTLKYIWFSTLKTTNDIFSTIIATNLIKITYLHKNNLNRRLNRLLEDHQFVRNP